MPLSPHKKIARLSTGQDFSSCPVFYYFLLKTKQSAGARYSPVQTVFVVKTPSRNGRASLNLFHFDDAAGSLELALGIRSRSLGNARQDLGTSSLGHGLGFHQAQVGQLADDLDDFDLLGAGILAGRHRTQSFPRQVRRQQHHGRQQEQPQRQRQQRKRPISLPGPLPVQQLPRTESLLSSSTRFSDTSHFKISFKNSRCSNNLWR